MAGEINTIYGPEDTLGLPKTSMGLFLFECLKKRSFNDVVYEDAYSNVTISAGCLLENSIKLVSVFQMMHLEKDDVVSIVLENNINYFSIILAGLYMGVIVNPLNPEYTEGEFRHFFEITQPKLIICSETVLPIIQNITAINLSTKILLLNVSANHHQIPNIEQLMQETCVDLSTFKPLDFDYSSQLALISLSSGTTGLPKGVVYTHQNVRALAIHVRTLDLESKSSCTIQFQPSFHIYGITLLMGAVINETKVVIMRKFKPDVFLGCVEKHRVQTIFAVPQILGFLANTDLLKKYDVSSLKYIFCGSYTVSKTVIELLMQRLNGLTVLQLYGLTETSGACVYQKSLNAKLGSVGSLMPGCIAKVSCIKTQQSLGSHKVGEICFKGNIIFKGYYKNDEATRKCIDNDGYLHTGDLGYYDEDHCFFIVDRIKDIIKYKGFQVSPAELENLILQHPCVKECGVVGIPDERSCEVPLAFVVLHQGMSTSEKEIIDYVADRISVHKRLYGGVRFLENMPKTSMGKVQRQVLRNLCQT